jgi:hypothetical protein
MPAEVVESIMSAESKGQEQWMSFVQRRKEKFYDAIPRNSIPLFSRVSKLHGKRRPSKLATAKQDINLFSRMYVSCQNRDGDVGNFFRHENHAWPPSLAEDGNMRTSENKSDLLAQLEPLVELRRQVPEIDVAVVDGAALVQSHNPKNYKTVKTFQDYCNLIFIPAILRNLESSERCDIVWDVY